MADSPSPDSPLEAAAETAGARTTEAFSILGNETRLSILLALWETYEPFAEENSVPFDELREHVGVEDPDRFTYHLQKLSGHYIRETDAGYELRQAGRLIVRTVVAGAGLEDPEFEPTEIDAECPFCEAPTAVIYRDDWLYHVCTNCDGGFGAREDMPDGLISGGAFPPAGITDRTPSEMMAARSTRSKQHFLPATEGVCSVCAGPMETSLHVCEDHASEGICGTCGRRDAVMARFRCPVCKDWNATPPRGAIAYHPAVIAFYHERGVPIQYETDDLESHKRAGQLVAEHEQELVSEDPLRVRVTVAYEGDELRLTVDENLDVIELEEPDS